MRVGLFTDTYFPQSFGGSDQYSDAQNRIRKLGHTVFIFTTTDKDVNRYEDWQIIRIPSVPFFAFKDRRVAYRGFSKALAILSNTSWILSIPRLSFHWAFWGVDWTRACGFQLFIPTIPSMGLCPLYCERYGHSPKYGQIHCEKLYE